MTIYALHEMLCRSRVVTAQHTLTWKLLASSTHNAPVEAANELLVRSIAQQIARDVAERGTWRREKLPEGEHYRLLGYWQSYDEMMALLEEAYTLGRKYEHESPIPNNE